MAENKPPSLSRPLRSLDNIQRIQSKNDSLVKPALQSKTQFKRPRVRQLKPVKKASPKKPAKDRGDPEYDELDYPNDLEGYRKICKIGEGTYGVVFKAREVATNKLVALKKVRLNLQEGVPTTTIREVAILRRLRNEHVIRLRDMIQRDATVYLVFDYSDMDFKRYMDKMKREGLTAAHIKSFMHQLLRGLHYCHANRIIHRDLKPQNLLVDRHGRLTIADLGLSRAFGIPLRTYTHQVITLWYRAPEILLGSPHYSTPVDMWSVGCIMAEMITLLPIFPGTSQIDQLFHIFRKLGTPNEGVWPGVSTLPDFNENFPPWSPRDLRQTLESSKHGIELPDSAYDLLQKLLTYDPVSRISVVRAEEHPYFFEDTTVLA